MGLIAATIETSSPSGTQGRRLAVTDALGSAAIQHRSIRPPVLMSKEVPRRLLGMVIRPLRRLS